MISETAMQTLDDMIAKGLKPTPRDIVRLNAVGLKLEAASAKSVKDSTYLLPRVAALSDAISFRQPTIGHEIWLEKVFRFVRDGDYYTVLALNAFALSRPADELPDPDAPAAVQDAAASALEILKPFTRDQIYAAIKYVKYGCDHTIDERYATPKDNDAPPDDDDSPDWSECIALGVLNEGRAMLWGMSEADMKRMTTHELNDVIERAKIYHKMSRSDGEDKWQGRYYATVDEITERLEAERKT